MRRKSKQENEPPSKRQRREESSETSILDLPDDLIISICSNFGRLRDLLQVRLVSKRLQRLSDNDLIWKQITELRRFTVKKEEFEGYKAYFVRVYTTYCVDCQSATKKKLYGTIPIPLCENCREGYIDVHPDQHFVTRVRAKTDYGLNDKELKLIPYGLCTNPVDPNWAAMNLFWKKDIESATIKKFGSLSKRAKQKKDRILKNALKD